MVGYGETCDANHITAPIETGEGATKAMRIALKDANIPPAAPSPCPVAPFVEEIYKSFALSPNNAFIALVSTTSFVGVEVP